MAAKIPFLRIYPTIEDVLEKFTKCVVVSRLAVADKITEIISLRGGNLSFGSLPRASDGLVRCGGC